LEVLNGLEPEKSSNYCWGMFQHLMTPEGNPQDYKPIKDGVIKPGW
jgi:hypothetical protein